MMVGKAIRVRILKLCGENNRTINKLAAKSGLAPSSVKSILCGRSQNPKVITIREICAGFGITFKEFF